MTRKALHRDRLSYAKTAWGQLKAARPELPDRIPPLFEAGFTLGMVTRADQEKRKDDDE